MRPTLDRFLASPTTVVPGSAMVIPVPKKEDRENIVAYFSALKDGTFKDATPQRRGPPPGMGANPNAGPPKGEADWKKDAPGRLHKIDVAKLPAPFDTPSASNFPKLIDKPAGASIKVPAGFKVDTFATGFTGPRAMLLAPNGDIILTEANSGRVKVIRPSKDNTRAESVEVFAQGLLQPYGVAFYPQKDPKWIYIGEMNRVVRYAYKVGDMKASGVPEVVVGQLSPSAAVTSPATSPSRRMASACSCRWARSPTSPKTCRRRRPTRSRRGKPSMGSVPRGATRRIAQPCVSIRYRTSRTRTSRARPSRPASATA